LVVIISGVWHGRHPTALQLDSGDLVWVERDADGVPRTVPAPERIVVDEGVARGPVELGWHDAPVDRLYVDEAHQVAFTGTIDPAARSARDAAGHEVLLFGDAAESGAPLTMLAFRHALAPIADIGHHLVLVSVFLFGISTAISWCYYGERCTVFVLGPRAVMGYRIVYVGMHFLGAVVPLSVAWTLGDAMLGIAMLPNLVVLWALSGEVAVLSRSYFSRRPWLAHHRRER
jgi:AGCS family alanine or glycine:cation symporter